MKMHMAGGKPVEIWPDERVELLKQHWNKHDYISDIAAILGVSKGATISKARRLKLPTWSGVFVGANGGTRLNLTEEQWAARRREQEARRRARKKTRYRGERKWTPPVYRPFVEPTPETAVRLAELNGHTCRWPIGEPAGFDTLFCGADPVPEQSYCPYHHMVAHAVPNHPPRAAIVQQSFRQRPARTVQDSGIQVLD